MSRARADESPWRGAARVAFAAACVAAAALAPLRRTAAPSALVRAPRAAAPALPFYDVVIVVPNPWAWTERRTLVADAFAATAARVAARGGTEHAALVFVLGDDAAPAALSASDAVLAAQPDVHFVTARDCPDLDEPWPEANDGALFPPDHSSTTCKVLEGAAWATEHFSFRYLARAGDDAYLRWDYFLAERAAALPTSRLMLGRFSPAQFTFSHIFSVFGDHNFLPYALGAGYIMTADVAAYLGAGYRARPHVLTAGPEDAAVGLVLYPLVANNEHTDDFHDPKQRACSRSSILVHYATPTMFAAIDPETGEMPCG
jgi:hypothetical protein